MIDHDHTHQEFESVALMNFVDSSLVRIEISIVVRGVERNLQLVDHC